MHGLYDLVDYSPLHNGEIYRNSKTKHYTDGTTNTIVSRSSIFKDKSIITEYMNSKEDRKQKEETDRRTSYENLIDEVYEILKRCEISDRDFSIIESHEREDDFLIVLSDLGMTLDEYDTCKRYFSKSDKVDKKTASQSEPRSDSMKRAKDQVFDYVLNNEFKYFFTGTINPERIDSTNPKEVLKPVQDWLKNMVKRYGLHYIMIAEYHIKSGGIHFHGLMYSEKELHLKDSGTKLYKGYKKPVSNERAEELGLYEGRTVYNLMSWKFGYTTCIELEGDRMKTAFYITKYITKDCKKIFGKFFWHSRNIDKPSITLEDRDFDSVESIETNGFKYIFKRGIENEAI